MKVFEAEAAGVSDRNMTFVACRSAEHNIDTSLPTETHQRFFSVLNRHNMAIKILNEFVFAVYVAYL